MTTENTPHVRGPDDPDYFTGYAHLSIHRTMLQDKTRTLAYKDAILNAKAQFKDKIVLDLGCGTGILSHFCLRAGAKTVYAVDASDIADQARLIAEENGVADRLIVLKGRIEELTLPSKVDIIVSEWMGYCLLYESMLDSVLFARDTWLNKDTGFLFPSHATIYMAPISDDMYYEDTVDCWQDMYGVKMKSLMPLAQQCFFYEADVNDLMSTNLMGSTCELVTLDLMKTQAADLRELKCNYSMDVTRNANLTGFCLWFDVLFATTTPSDPPRHRGRRSGPIVLSTSPFSTPTHWQQTTLHLPSQIPLFEGDPVSGTIYLRSNPIHVNRKMTFELHLNTFEVILPEPSKDEDETPKLSISKNHIQDDPNLVKLIERASRWRTAVSKTKELGAGPVRINTKHQWCPGGIPKSELPAPTKLGEINGSLKYDFGMV